jgi:hypothetical protein
MAEQTVASSQIPQGSSPPSVFVSTHQWPWPKFAGALALLLSFVLKKFTVLQLLLSLQKARVAVVPQNVSDQADRIP